MSSAAALLSNYYDIPSDSEDSLGNGDSSVAERKIDAEISAIVRRKDGGGAQALLLAPPPGLDASHIETLTQVILDECTLDQLSAFLTKLEGTAKNAETALNAHIFSNVARFLDAAAAATTMAEKLGKVSESAAALESAAQESGKLAQSIRADLAPLLRQRRQEQLQQEVADARATLAKLPVQLQLAVDDERWSRVLALMQRLTPLLDSTGSASHFPEVLEVAAAVDGLSDTMRTRLDDLFRGTGAPDLPDSSRLGHFNDAAQVYLYLDRKEADAMERVRDAWTRRVLATVQAATATVQQDTSLESGALTDTLMFLDDVAEAHGTVFASLPGEAEVRSAFVKATTQTVIGAAKACLTAAEDADDFGAVASRFHRVLRSVAESAAALTTAVPALLQLGTDAVAGAIGARLNARLDAFAAEVMPALAAAARDGRPSVSPEDGTPVGDTLATEALASLRDLLAAEAPALSLPALDSPATLLGVRLQSTFLGLADQLIQDLAEVSSEQVLPATHTVLAFLVAVADRIESVVPQSLLASGQMDVGAAVGGALAADAGRAYQAAVRRLAADVPVTFDQQPSSSSSPVDDATVSLVQHLSALRTHAAPIGATLDALAAHPSAVPAAIASGSQPGGRLDAEADAAVSLDGLIHAVVLRCTATYAEALRGLSLTRAERIRAEVTCEYLRAHLPRIAGTQRFSDIDSMIRRISSVAGEFCTDTVPLSQTERERIVEKARSGNHQLA